MAFKLVEAAKHRIHESSLNHTVSKLSQHPEQLAIRGRNNLFIFQPHVICSMQDEATWEITDSLIGQQTGLFMSEGRRLVFYMEDANKRALASRKARETHFRSGQNVDGSLERMIARREARGDGEARYQSLQLTAIKKQMDDHHGKDPSVPQIVVLFEQAPKIQTPGMQSFNEADPRTSDPETAYRRTLQIMSYAATRDIVSSAQLIREVENYPDSAFIVMRGVAHLGMATCIEEMAAQEFPHLVGAFADVDKARTVDLGDVLSAIASPLSWKRDFWRAIFDRNPRLLQLPRTFTANQDMTSTANSVRAILNGSPWSDYIRCMVAEAFSFPDCDVMIRTVLNQDGL